MYLQTRCYSLAEVVELTGIDLDYLKAVLMLEVVPADVIEKIAFHIGATTVKDFFNVPGDGQPFG
ncbi:MAG: hypothetical protein JNN28_12280 [Saprospiraceae bacterium]|nr:hypothetical protein [Saprospiraceae bacterium]